MTTPSYIQGDFEVRKRSDSSGGNLTVKGVLTAEGGIVPASMPKASTESFGAVKIGSGIDVSDGVVSVGDLSDKYAELTDGKIGTDVIPDISDVYAEAEHTHTIDEITDYSAYILPTASASTLGGIKVGSGLSVTADGTLSAEAYVLPQATSSTIGGVTVGTSAGDCPVLDANGKIDASVLPPGMANGRYLGTASNVSTGVAQWGLTAVRGDFFRLSTTKAYCVLGADEGAVIANWQEFGGAVTSVNGQKGDVTIPAYELPTASASVLGGVKVGSRLTIADGVLSADEQTYTLPSATTSALGGVMLVSNIETDTSKVPTAGNITGYCRENYSSNRKATVINTGTVPIKDGVGVYIHTPVSDTSYVFDKGSVVSDLSEFELIIKYPAYALTFPSDIWWEGGTIPAINNSDYIYHLKFTNVGGQVLGKLVATYHDPDEAYEAQFDYVVATLNDVDSSSPLSLRTALAQAASAGTYKKIGFKRSLASGTARINLSSMLTISSNVEIDASGLSHKIILDGNYQKKILLIDTAENVVLKNLAFKNGYGTDSGSAINGGVCGSVKIYGCLFSGNTTAGTGYVSGGAISFNTVTLECYDCQFETNVCTCTNAGTSVSSRGGAVCLDTAGSVSFTNCMFYNNKSQGKGPVYGGAVCVWGGTSSFTQCLLVGNLVKSTGAGAYGGGWYGGASSANASFYNCTISDNTSNAPSLAFGGGLDNDAGCGPLVVNSCIVWRNTASYGPSLCKNGNSGSFHCCLYDNTECLFGNGISPSGTGYDIAGESSSSVFVDSGSYTQKYNLKDGSLAIGDNSHHGGNAQSLTGDIAGNSRVVGTYVDFGCYEYQG